MSALHTALGADVLAAGTVLWRPVSGDGRQGDHRHSRAVEVALVHRPRYDDWSLPKGKLDKGLDHGELADCALRETREETGVAARLGARLGDVRYGVPEGRKLVRYWAAEAVDDAAFVANDETDELRWVPLADAPGLVTYSHDRDVLARFRPPASVLVLVRHAKAGSRKDWEGDDDLRPLSSSGRAQAAHLVGFLGRFAPERFHASPPVRCPDTLAPYASTLDAAITPEPLLGEEGYWEDPAAGLVRFRALLGTPGVTALCSQGGVIPDVVETLLDESGVRPYGMRGTEPVPSRKASTWLLTADPHGRLLSADYYPTP
ncbi:NUDIX hydrolase [Pseudonocardia ailaonensis]|uniref:NUDIX hydrolase n=1 Tax=Pseudonocardia ailaonensis TaxID=367279 RepID=A0ABN2NB75_9PSEU